MCIILHLWSSIILPIHLGIPVSAWLGVLHDGLKSSITTREWCSHEAVAEAELWPLVAVGDWVPNARRRADGEGRRAQGRSSQSCFYPAAQQAHWLHNYSSRANKARCVCCVYCPSDNKAQIWNDWSLTYLLTEAKSSEKNPFNEWMNDCLPP